MPRESARIPLDCGLVPAGFSGPALAERTPGNLLSPDFEEQTTNGFSAHH